MFLSTRLFIRWVLLWPNLTGARHKGINANFQVPFHPLGRSGRGWSVLFFHHIAVDTTWVGHANPPAHPHTGVRERGIHSEAKQQDKISNLNPRAKSHNFLS